MLRLRAIALITLGCLCQAAFATDVSLVGVSGTHAFVVIDGAAPRVMTPGSSYGPVQLMSVSGDRAVFTIDGARETIQLGQFYGPKDTGKASATLTADSQGAFIGLGTINGKSIRFMADTGASFVVMNGEQADSLGIAWRSAPEGIAGTANGMVRFHKVKLASVKVGEIVINDVDAAVQESGLASGVLLGQSFLNRTDMQRTGNTMTLTKRF